MAGAQHAPYTWLFDVWLLHRGVQRLLDGALADSGLTAEDFSVYAAIWRGYTRPGDIAEFLALPATTVSSIVRRIERRGHLSYTVDTLDRRARRVELTVAGAAANRQAARLFRASFAQLEAHLTAPDLIHGAIREMRAAVDEAHSRSAKPNGHLASRRKETPMSSQPPVREQRRGRSIAMTAAERDTFLAEERTCRVATVSAAGPHNTPLWFVWDGHSLWLNSIVSSQRWTDIQLDPRVSVVVDTGHEFTELRGVELRGELTAVGEAPRTGAQHAELEIPERLFAHKYTGIDQFGYDGRHGWLRLIPAKITSWDFRKQFAKNP